MPRIQPAPMENEKRRVNCRHYSRCLMAAARKGRSFSCSECLDFEPETYTMEELKQEGIAAYRLLRKVWPEWFRRR